MKRRLWRLFGVLLAAMAAAAAVLGGFALVPVAEGWTAAALPIFAAAGVFTLSAWVLHGLLKQHFDDLALLHLSLQLTQRGEVPPEQLQTRWSGESLDEVGQIARVVTEIATRRALERARPDQRLASVIAALGDAVVVVTEDGQISLINAVGKALLGHDRAAVGTSIYAAIERDSLVAALAAAQTGSRSPVAVRLRTVEGEELPARITDFGAHRGAVITIPAREVEHYAEVEHALDLHDRPPPAPPPLLATPLDDLPGIVIDTETTGLDVNADSIVSIGAVRLHGRRIYPGVTIDRLVNPGRPIPARSTAVHGITNAMVAEAPPARAVLPDLLDMMRGTVVVGHNTGFDLAMLRRAAAEAHLPWNDPPWLDVMLLYAALYPTEKDLNLETMALRLGVNVSGRHTALGDSLVTAEVYVRLLDRLAERGIVTFGQAMDFGQTAKHVVAQQKQAGW